MNWKTFVLLMLTASGSRAAETTPPWVPNADELSAAKSWAKAHLGEGSKALPFSFTYDGKPSADLLPQWKQGYAEKKLDGKRIERTLSFTDPQTGLLARCIAVEYSDYPTVEWSLDFKNTGAADTPIIADIKAIDVRFERAGGEFTLHWNTGDNCSGDSYQPHADTMPPSVAKHLNSVGGRPTTGALPYCNLEFDGGGVILVVNWGGQWSADFVRDTNKMMRVSGGQELTHFKLLPTESVSQPMGVVQFYRGDYNRSQNIWRRWMLAHNVPKDWKPVMWSNSEGADATQFGEATEMKALNQFEKHGVKLDFYEMDAGWYPDGKNWWNTGTWEPDPGKWPRGLKPLGEKVHSLGYELMVWFEPERVTRGSWLSNNHPEWILSGTLLNLGNPDARQWVVDRVDKLVTEGQVDIYRQDFNMEPLPCWRGNDASDRQGITEIKHIMGLYAWWDELKRRHPKIRFDSCASGGRRADLDTLRRAVVLMRSDYWLDPVGNQCFMHGFTPWCPYFGTGSHYNNEYEALSKTSIIMGIGHSGSRDSLDWDLFNKRIAQGRMLQKYLLYDFYPLTPYTLKNNVWFGWQFNSPEKGVGLVQAFRRADCPDESVQLKLYGLAPDAQYAVTEMDGAEARPFTGKELMDKGLVIRAASAPQAKVFTYEKVGQRL